MNINVLKYYFKMKFKLIFDEFIIQCTLKICEFTSFNEFSWKTIESQESSDSFSRGCSQTHQG